MGDAAALAVAVLRALLRGGVADVVLAPGSRSAPLAVALQQADAQGLLRLHVRIDERTAGFLALGLAKGSRRPVAVATTSGSAVANLHPAVLEAVHVGERLVILSADRPARLRGTGANQTTDQVGLFGDRLPCADVGPADVSAAESAIARAVHRAGPSHVNLQFAEPLMPEALGLPGGLADGPRLERRSAEPSGGGRPIRLPMGPRTVVVAGDNAGPRSRGLAEDANWPLFAEPTSGARTGTHAVRTYRLLLESDLASQIERVVVTGHPTLSRPVTRLISRPDIEVISVSDPGGTSTDPGLVARRVESLPRAAGADGDTWIDLWREADARLAAMVDDLAAAPGGRPLRIAGAVASAVGPGGLLFVGSSQPIRDLDIMAPPPPVGHRRRIIGNRGLSGIDGPLSTAVGAALGRPSPHSLAYVGDLAFLHDANGLVIGPDEPRPDLTIVVANDDGGAIFSTLEQGGPEYSAAFERVFGTPHGVSLRALCEATQTTYERIDDIDGLRARLAQTVHGIRVVEVPISRANRRELAARLRRLVT